MTAKQPIPNRHVAEAVANSITHGAGLVASILAFPLLVTTAAARGDGLQVTGAAVYGTSLILLYAASTVYHSFVHSRLQRVMRVIDHSAIYILIAGSYTPFALGPLRGTFGYSLLAALWTMAVAGIAMKFLKGFTKPWLTVAPYVAMGWFGILAIKPLLANVGMHGVLWLVAGGLFYTGGVIFYANDKRVPYGHAVWHLFVIAGSACHFCAVLWYSGITRT